MTKRKKFKCAEGTWQMSSHALRVFDDDLVMVRKELGGSIYFFVETGSSQRIFTFPSERRLFEVINHGSLIFRVEVSGEDPQEQVIRDYLNVEGRS